MSNNLNNSILAKIVDILPENIKPVNYFMDVLDLGKESAYRRLRGEKTLSLEEVYKLSVELGFSLDEIFENKNTDSFAFNYIGSKEESLEDNFLEFLLYYEKYLTHMLQSEHTEIICTMNNLLNTTLVEFDELFKFIYYRWVHQTKEVPLNFHLADLEIPTEIKSVCRRIDRLQQQIKKTTFIIDKNMNINLIKEIQYFYVRGLIKENELTKLKEELLRYIDRAEKIITKGVTQNGNIFEIYLSMLNINSTTTYAIWNENAESAFWNNLCYPMHTRNKQITDGHKRWIDSLKKYSTVITQSNELLQANYINEQRTHINNIAEKILL